MRPAAIAIALALAGCGAKLYALRAGELAPAVLAVPADSRLAVWQHAVVVLLDQGYVPTVLNETAGYISAKRRDDFNDDALAGTVALVTISPAGEVRVALAGAGTFNSEGAFVQAMTDRQGLLARAIAAPPGAPPVAPPRAP